MKKNVKLFSFLAVMALLMLSFKKSPDMKGKCDGKKNTQ